MPAPVASGWSDRRVGLAPTGKSAALSRRTWVPNVKCLPLTGDRSAARRSMRFCWRRFLSPFTGSLELAQSRGGCRVRLGLDRAILVDQSCSEGRQRGAAAMASARLSDDDRLPETVVHIVD